MRIYLSGVDGNWWAVFVGITIALSFILSLIIFRQPLPALGIFAVGLVGIIRFFARYKRIYNQTGIDDPLERDLEGGNLTKVYRDDNNFLS